MSTFLKNSIRFITVLLLFVCVSHAHADPNPQLTFTGNLANTSETPLSGTYDMVFRIYETPTGGTPVATSTHTAANGNPVTVTDGEFSVEIGSGVGNSLAGLNFETDAFYVGLTIESDSEMTPRERFASAAYSFNANYIDGFDSSVLVRNNATGTIATSSTDTILSIVQSGGGDILNLYDGSTEVFTVTNAGNVGIGTSTPLHELVIAGNLNLAGAVYDRTSSVGTDGYVLRSTGTGVEWVSPASLGISTSVGDLYFTDGGATTYLTSLTDTLAVGTTTGTDVLTVNGSLSFPHATDLSINATNLFTINRALLSLYIGQNTPGHFDETWTENTLIIGRDAASSTDQFEFPYAFDGTLIGSQVWGSTIYSPGGTGDTFIGTQSGYQAVDGWGYSTLIGTRSGERYDGGLNVGIGYEALASTSNAVSYETAVGYRAGREGKRSTNSIMGYLAGELNTAGAYIMVGAYAGRSNIGDDGWFFGSYAGENNSGDNVNGLGQYAAQNNSGSYNNMIGYQAGAENTGDNNDILGYQAGLYYGGDQSVILGSEAYKGTASFTSDNNVIIGYRAGMNVQSGAEGNILIGYQAADNLSTGTDNIVIGYDVDLQDPTSTSTVNIGNLIFAVDGYAGNSLGVGMNEIYIGGKYGIGTSTPSAAFTTTGSVRFAGLGSGAVQSDADGNLTVSSDERLKNILSVYATGTHAVLNMEPILYSWKESTGYDTKNIYLGFSAQNIQTFLPEAVDEDSVGFLTLSDRGILAAVVNTIKDIWKRLEDQSSTIFALTERANDLRSEIENDDLHITELKSRVSAIQNELNLDPIDPSQYLATTSSNISTTTEQLFSATTTPPSFTSAASSTVAQDTVATSSTPTPTEVTETDTDTASTTIASLITI